MDLLSSFSGSFHVGSFLSDNSHENRKSNHNSHQINTPTYTNEHITLYLEFQSYSLNTQYQTFKIASSNQFSLFIVTMILTCLYCLYWIFVLYVKRDWLTIGLWIITLWMAMLPLWILLWLRVRIPLNEQIAKYKVFMTFLETYVMIGWSLTWYLIIIYRLLQGACTSFDFISLWSCNPGQVVGGISGDTSFIYLTMPLLFTIAMPFIPQRSVMIIQGLMICSMITLISFKRATTSATLIVLLCFFSWISIYFYRLQHMELFLYSSKFERSLEIRSRETQENSKRLSNELRLMITNIAHDLRSVRNKIYLCFTLF